jgi:hypothetical protein
MKRRAIRRVEARNHTSHHDHNNHISRRGAGTLRSAGRADHLLFSAPQRLRVSRSWLRTDTAREQLRGTKPIWGAGLQGGVMGPEGSNGRYRIRTCDLTGVIRAL